MATRNRVKTTTLITAMVSLLIACAASSAQNVRYPDRIGQFDHILDGARMLEMDDAAAIGQLCAPLLAENEIPIVIVTINSLSEFDAGGQSIEQYARGLFDNWGIGRPDYNYGILLLVAKGDRRARIELGADWGFEYDETCLSIMNDLIIPEFKADRFSSGIRLGVEGLKRMARGESLPSRPMGPRIATAWNSFWKTITDTVKNMMGCLMVPFILIASLFGGGSDGDSSGSFGGFGGSSGGGSFGGGFSGGGGASGSW